MWYYWIIIIAAALAAIGVIAWKIVEFSKMPTEEKKKLLKKWMIGAVVIAEDMFNEHGKGAEKMKIVLDDFKKNAPILYKWLAKIDEHIDLQKVAEEALEAIKKNFEYN